MAKRLIDANAYAFPGDLINEPTVDAVEVVRCRDCRYAKFESKCSKYYCLHFPECFRYANDFCSYGERKGGQAPQREDV